MDIQLIRHATLLIRMGENRILVDPMLSPAETRPPIQMSPNPRRNPLVPLPELDLRGVDAVLVTHVHSDHFDDAAAGLLPRNVPLFCQ